MRTGDILLKNINKEPGNQAIEPIDVTQLADFFLSFAQKTNTKLHPSEEKRIAEATKNKLLIDLIEQLNAFTQLKAAYSALPGLSSQEGQTFSSNYKQMQQYQRLSPEERNQQEALEKSLEVISKHSPLNKTTQWWKINHASFCKEDLWEQFSKMTSNVDTSQPSVTLKRQQEIRRIKERWLSHQAFAGYASDHLYTFYHEQLLVLEECIHAVMKKKQPALIQTFLNHTLTTLTQIKRETVSSMLARLQCAEYFSDIHCDALLTHLNQRIEQAGKINLQGNGFVPPPRKSLNPDLFEKFFSITASYCKANAKDDLICSGFESLKTQQAARQNDYANDPILCFTSSMFPTLTTKLNNEKDIDRLVSFTLSAGSHDEPTFILNQLHQLLSQTQDRLQAFKKTSSAAEKARQLVTHLTLEYKKAVSQIQSQLKVNLQKKLDDILDLTFSNQAIDAAKISSLYIVLDNANEFLKKHSATTYLPNADIILAISKRIKSTLAKDMPISSTHADNISQLLQPHYIKLCATNATAYNQHLAQLPALTRQLKSQPGDILPYIVNFLERPIVAAKKVDAALLRHQHIAHYKQWDPIEALAARDNADEKLTYSLCSYLKNVSLRMLPTSSAVSLATLNNNPFYDVLIDLEKSLSVNKDPSKSTLQKKEIASSLREAFESAVLAKLNDHFSLQDYLREEESNLIDTQKLSTLLDDARHFFKNSRLKNHFIDAVYSASFSLLKNYCIYIIKYARPLDAAHIEEIDKLLGTPVFYELANDENFKTLLQSHIKLYTGDNTDIARLLIKLIPAKDCHGDNKKLILDYTKRRLEMIFLKREATREDYSLFNEYKNVIPELEHSFADATRRLKTRTKSFTDNQHSDWNAEAAGLIELFESPETIIAYRAKRIDELFDLELDSSKENTEAIKAQFHQFKASLNPHMLVNGRPLSPQHTLTKNISLEARIQDAIKHREWSWLLENLINLCGTPQQTEQLHKECVLRYLNANDAPPTKTWISKRLLTISNIVNQNTTDHDEINRQNARAKNEFIAFFGKDNIAILCANLNAALSKLITIDADAGQHEVSDADLKSARQLIQAVMPLACLYQLFGNNPEHVALTYRLNEVNKKIILHHKMHTILRQHPFLTKLSQEDPDLHNLILSFVDNVRLVEADGQLSPENINVFIAIFNQQILAPIEQAYFKPADKHTSKRLSVVLPRNSDGALPLNIDPARLRSLSNRMPSMKTSSRNLLPTPLEPVATGVKVELPPRAPRISSMVLTRAVSLPVGPSFDHDNDESRPNYNIDNTDDDQLALSSLADLMPLYDALDSEHITDAPTKAGNDILTNPSLMNFETLATLSNLLIHLASPRLRKMLLEANVEEVDTNPCWLTLTNHAEEGHELAKIQQAIENFEERQINYFIRNPSYRRDLAISQRNNPELPITWTKPFKSAFTFSERVWRLTQRINFLLKISLVKEADIDPVSIPARSFSDLVKHPSVTNQQLLRLWSSCADKMNANHLTRNQKFPYVMSLVRCLLTVSTELIRRTHLDRNLMKLLIELMKKIPALILSIVMRFGDQTQTQIPAQKRSLWLNPSDTFLLVNPIKLMVERVHALHMLYIIEVFVSGKIEPALLTTFRQLCKENKITDESLAKTLKVTDANNIKKLTHAANLYTQLTHALQHKVSLTSLKSSISSLVNDTKLNRALPFSNYHKMLVALNSQFTQFELIQADIKLNTSNKSTKPLEPSKK